MPELMAVTLTSITKKNTGGMGARTCKDKRSSVAEDVPSQLPKVGKQQP